MDELQQFIYYDNVAMAVKQDDDFWFVVKDVRKVLEIRLSHSAVANCPEGNVRKMTAPSSSGDRNILL